jgi:hypothetical protein
LEKNIQFKGLCEFETKFKNDLGIESGVNKRLIYERKTTRAKETHAAISLIM